MSSIGDIQLDDDGFIDMSQFPDDGAELDTVAEADLRGLLLADPVEEPDDLTWDAFLTETFDHADGPFAVDDGPVVDPTEADADVVVDLGGHDDLFGDAADSDSDTDPAFEDSEAESDGGTDEVDLEGSDLDAGEIVWDSGVEELDTAGWDATDDIVDADVDQVTDAGSDFEDLL